MSLTGEIGDNKALDQVNHLSMMKSPNIESCVERLCLKGCKAVWHDIAVLEDGEKLPETRKLSIEENRAVLRELKAVMSVYNRSGSCTTE